MLFSRLTHRLIMNLKKNKSQEQLGFKNEIYTNKFTVLYLV